MSEPHAVNDHYATDPIRPGYIVVPSHKSQGGIGAPDNSGLSASGFNPNTAPVRQLVDPDYPDRYVWDSTVETLDQAKNKKNTPPAERRITDNKPSARTLDENNIRMHVNLSGVKVPFRVNKYHVDTSSSSLWLIYVNNTYNEILEFDNSEFILSTVGDENNKGETFTCKYYGHKLSFDRYTIQMFVLKPTQ